MRIKGIIYQAIALSLAVWTIIAFQLGSFANDPGLGWHLKTGAWIAEHLQIPYTDPFFGGAEERAWISDQWLSDLILHQLYILTDWPGLYAIMSLVFLSIYFLWPNQIVYKFSGSSLVTALAGFLCFKLGLLHFVLRPLIFGHLLFVLLFVWLLDFYYAYSRENNFSGAQSKLRRLCWALPILFFVWANIHPSFVVGLFVLFILLFALVVDRFFYKLAFPSDLTNLVLLIILLSSLATFINPYSYSLHQSILSLAQSEFFMNLNSEWKALNFKAPEGFFLELVILILILGFLARAKRLGRWRSFEFGLILCFLHLALGTARMLPYLGIILMPFLAEAISGLVEKSSEKFGVLSKYFKAESSSYLGGQKLLFGLVVVFFILPALYLGKIIGYAGHYGPDPAKFPYGALRYLLELDAGSQPLQKSIVYSTPNWGGFIIWSGQDRLSPAIDDRNFLNGETVYRDYLEVIKAKPLWRSILSKSGAKYALIPADEPLAQLISAEKAPLFADPISALYQLDFNGDQ